MMILLAIGQPGLNPVVLKCPASWVWIHVSYSLQPRHQWRRNLGHPEQRVPLHPRQTPSTRPTAVARALCIHASPVPELHVLDRARWADRGDRPATAGTAAAADPAAAADERAGRLPAAGRQQQRVRPGDPFRSCVWRDGDVANHPAAVTSGAANPANSACSGERPLERHDLGLLDVYRIESSFYSYIFNQTVRDFKSLFFKWQ